MRRNTFVQCFFGILISLLFAACGKKCQEPTFVTEEFTDSISTESPTLVYTFNASIDIPECGLSKDVISNLRNNIVSAVLGNNYVEIGNKKLLKKYSADSYDEFLASVESLASDVDFTFYSTIDLSGRVNYISIEDSILGYERFMGTYSGGAHGMQTVVNYIFDLRTGNIIDEEEIFNDIHNPAFIQLLTNEIDKLRQEGVLPDETEIFSNELVLPNGNWGINEKGLYITFDPYQIAPYSFGVIDITLANEDIKEFINRNSPIYSLINK